MENTLNSREIEKLFKVSFFTLRSWRRGWHSSSLGKHYFFPDKSYLKHHWNAEVRQFEFNPVEVEVWSKRLKAKKSARQSLGGKLTKEQYHRGGLKGVFNEK